MSTYENIMVCYCRRASPPVLIPILSALRHCYCRWTNLKDKTDGARPRETASAEETIACLYVLSSRFHADDIHFSFGRVPPTCGSLEPLKLSMSKPLRVQPRKPLYVPTVDDGSPVLMISISDLGGHHRHVVRGSL